VYPEIIARAKLQAGLRLRNPGSVPRMSLAPRRAGLKPAPTCGGARLRNLGNTAYACDVDLVDYH
jgi:hypothetical protein